MISKQIKVLIVEDEKIVALDTKDMLESLGYSVTAIASFKEEALKKLEETKPDLALLDIRLYGSIAGVEIAEYIRIHHKIPFIYVTAYADENTLERAKTTAPYGYILKPFEEKELHTTIQIALCKHDFEGEIKKETENSLAIIINRSELTLEEGHSKHDQEILQRAEQIREAAHTINETIQKL